MKQPGQYRLNGRHVTAMMVLFFGTVIAVNLVMASQAVGTFGGTVVDNSYVASQQYNRWLAEARAQAADGWIVTVNSEQGRVELVLRDKQGEAIEGAVVTAEAAHPLGKADPVTLGFVGMGEGRYGATSALVAGPWRLDLVVEARGRRHLYRETLR